MLSACAAKPDNFSPRVVITEPEAGLITREELLTVRGQVIDDVGIASIQVAGQELPLEGGSDRIVPFAFRVPAANTEMHRIVVRDLAGHVTEHDIDVQFDPEPPTIRIAGLSRTDEGLLRLSATVLDNVAVATVTVNGEDVPITPGPRADVFVNLTGPDNRIEIEARDQAGNVATLSNLSTPQAFPLPQPSEPEPEPLL